MSGKQTLTQPKDVENLTNFRREAMRMPAMDLADVAYDAFLVNGKPEETLSAKAGETIRLRVIAGSASTFFHLSYAGGPMTIVSADGQAVEMHAEVDVHEAMDIEVQRGADPITGVGADEHASERRELLPGDQGDARAHPHRGRPELAERALDEAPLGGRVVADLRAAGEEGHGAPVLGPRWRF